MPKPTEQDPAHFFPSNNQRYFHAKRPHQRARLVRIAQVREEMTRVYNYMLRGFFASYARLRDTDPVKCAELYPHGFILTPAQAKACVLVLREVAALVHTQAIEAKLDMLKEKVKQIMEQQGLPPPEFADEKDEPPDPDAPANEEWASAQIEDDEVIEMEPGDGEAD